MLHDKLRHIHWLFLFLVLAGSILSCKRYPNNTRLLQLADTLMNEYPDSALEVLNQIINPYKLSEAERAHYALLSGLARNKTNRSLCEDSLLTDALSYYELRQDTSNLQTAYLLAGYYLYANQQLEKADSLLKKGLYLAKLGHDKKKIIQLYEALTTVNLNHNVVFDYPQIQNYMRACMELDPTPQRIFYYAVMLGFTNNDSIHYYGPLAIQQAVKTNDPYTWNYLLNYSSYLIKKKKYKEALQWMQSTDFSQPNNWDKKRCYLHMARCYLFLSQMDEAQLWLNRADSIPIPKDLSTENERIHLQGIIDYTRHRHVDMTYMFRFNDSILSNIHEKNSVVTAKNESKYNLERLNFQLKLEHERLLWGISCLIALIASVLFYIDYRRKRTLLRLQQQLSENRAELMKLQTGPEEEVQVSTGNEQQKIHQLRMEKIELCKKAFAKTAWSKRLATLNCCPNSTALSGQESSELTSTLTQCFIDVLIDLKQNSPKLNNAELTHTIFLLLGCPNRTISMCTFAAESTIRTRKVRIKEKLSEDYQAILFE